MTVLGQNRTLRAVLSYVRFGGESRPQFQATGCLLVATSGRSPESRRETFHIRGQMGGAGRCSVVPLHAGRWRISRVETFIDLPREGGMLD